MFQRELGHVERKLIGFHFEVPQIVVAAGGVVRVEAVVAVD
jgi:hypothetical protein